MKSDNLLVIFLLAWLLCACSADTMLDDPRVGVIALIAMIVATASAWALGGRED